MGVIVEPPPRVALRSGLRGMIQASSVEDVGFI